VKLEISKRARRHIEKRQAWWREHRPAALGLFLDELAAAERLLRATPELGSIYVKRNTRTVRRVLLPQTGTHVYYWLDANRDLVTILAVWGAQRGRTPRL
jgi:plasmid stabilization system protein ParE